MVKRNDVSELLDRVREEQEIAWRRGDRLLVEEHFARHADLAADQEAALDCVYGEYCLREELGDRPADEEYFARFPQWASQLAALFRLHAALQSSQLAGDETANLGPPGANADRDQPTVAWSDTARTSAEMAVISTHGAGGGRTKDSWRSAAPAGGVPTTSPPRFQILRSHAKGGLGEVFIARDDELNRDVALKEIQSQHAGDPDRRARFMLEAEITGGLEHPGVVPVYALGTYGDGRPFYAMRFIKGDSLQAAAAKFHARERLDWGLEFRQLLRRFLDVCNAMQYAHDRGVLHRDLKPANVVLGDYGETMVVDWGLAKTFRQRDAATTVAAPLQPVAGSAVEPTLLGSVAGTPSFMSPEQASGDLKRLGPASDVFSLGATLYFLLTGRTPFTGKSVTVVLQKVRTGDFPRPREIKADVPKPLEAICLRAMSLRAEDRYAGARSLAKDIESWLADDVVAAFRESWSARARRWLRKRPALTGSLSAAALVSLAALAIGLGVVSSKNRELQVANRNETTARQAETAAKLAAQNNERLANERKTEADSQRGRAEKRLVQVEKGVAVLGSIFEDLDPDSLNNSGQPLQAVLGMRLDRAAQELNEDAVGDALVAASLQRTLGKSLFELGHPDKAVQIFAKVRAVREAMQGREHPETLSSMSDLTGAYWAAGNYEMAASLGEETLRLLRATLGPGHVDTLRAMNALAAANYAAGKLSVALPLYEEALRLQAADADVDESDIVATMINLGLAYKAAGKLDLALPLYEESFERSKKLKGPDHPDTLAVMNNLASACKADGQLDRALSIYVESLRLAQGKLGPDHPDTLNSVNNLATCYLRVDKSELALPLLEDAFRRSKARLGPDHPATLITMNNLAYCHNVAGKRELAHPLFEEVLRLTKAKLGDAHPDTWDSMKNLAASHKAAGEYGLALPLYEQAVQLAKTHLDARDSRILDYLDDLAITQRRAGKLSESLASFGEVRRLTLELFGPDHAYASTSAFNLAKAHVLAGQPESAAPLYREHLSILQRRPDQNELDLAKKMASIGQELSQHGLHSAAEPMLRDSLGILERKMPDAWFVYDAKSLIGAALAGQGDRSAAETLLLEGFEGMQKRESQMTEGARPRLRDAAKRLVDLYTAWDNPEKAKEWQAKLDELSPKK